VGGEPLARALGQPGVPRVGLVQDAQRELDAQRLTARAAGVRLQRVAEPAVVIAPAALTAQRRSAAA
jgi:hypothetical protein